MGFKLEINTIDEFMQFIVFIRGEDLDVEKLKQFTKDLNTDADALKKAEANDATKSKGV